MPLFALPMGSGWVCLSTETLYHLPATTPQQGSCYHLWACETGEGFLVMRRTELGQGREQVTVWRGGSYLPLTCQTQEKPVDLGSPLISEREGERVPF